MEDDDFEDEDEEGVDHLGQGPEAADWPAIDWQMQIRRMQGGAGDDVAAGLGGAGVGAWASRLGGGGAAGRGWAGRAAAGLVQPKRRRGASRAFSGEKPLFFIPRSDRRGGSGGGWVVDEFDMRS